MRDLISAAKLWVILSAIAVSINAQPQTGPSLKEMVNNFAKQPDLYWHRRIIEESARSKIKLEIPSEAVTAFKRGIEKLSNTPNQQQKLAAIDDFKESVRLAPWWADATFNLGYAYERAEKLIKAETMYGYYLLSGPTPSDADKARKRIAELQKKAETLRTDVDSGIVTPEVFLDAMEDAVYDCGKDARYWFRMAIRNRGLRAEPVEHTPPKRVNGLMSAGLAPGPAIERRGLEYRDLGSTGFTAVVWSNQLVYSRPSRTCPRIQM